MTVKQYLSQLKFLNMKIDRKIEELELLRAETTRITTVLNPNKVQTSPKNDKLAEQVAKIIDLENEIDREVDNYYNAKQIIIKQIEEMDEPIYYNILHLKYIQNQTNGEIAEKLGYSLRQEMNLFSQAIISFDEKYGKSLVRY